MIGIPVLIIIPFVIEFVYKRFIVKKSFRMDKQRIYSGTVSNISTNRDAVYLELHDSTFLILTGNNCNYEYSAYSIGRVLRDNDSIYYNPTRSDTFYIYTPEQLVFKYILGKSINCNKY